MTVLSPAAVAEKYGVKIDTVHAWINSGSLKAIDVSRTRDGKLPRWKILPEYLAEFEAARANVKPAAKSRRQRQRPKPLDYVEYFS